MPQTLSQKLLRLKSMIQDCNSAVVAFSGGVDSSVVCAVAHECLDKKVVAVTAISPTYPPGEFEVAKEIARRIGIHHITIETNELDDPNFTSNPTDRCYHCKTELLRKLEEIRQRHGFEKILDGTNHDDLSDYRPGIRASGEFGVISPLAMAGLGKDEVRELAASYGLPNADKPANPCLASRVPFEHEITIEKLQRIARAEDFVRSLGFRIVRVRDLGDRAQVEVDKTEVQKALKMEEKIVDGLRRVGYPFALIDPRGYRPAGFPKT